MRARALVAVLVLLAGTACTAGSEPTPAPTGAARTPTFSERECPEEVALALLGDLRCGTLTVAEDREQGTGTTEVFVADLAPPEDRGKEPIVVVGTDVATQPNYAGIGPLTQRTGRRVLIIDQRGTGHSVPSLACPETGVAWWAATGSDRWRQQIGRATDECYEALTDEGIDVAAYDIAAMAADVVDLVHILDLEPVDLMTYGSASRISLEIMRSDDDLLRAVVMDSPDLPGADPRTYAASGVRTAVARVLRWCARDRACRRQHPQPTSLLRRALKSLDDRPLAVTVRLPEGRTDVRLDGALLVRLARRTLTDGGSSGPWGLPTRLPELLDRVASRGPGGLSEPVAELIGAQGPLCAGYRPKCTPAHVVAEGTANTVLCRDVAPFGGGRPSATRTAALRAAFDRSWWWETCTHWPVPPADPVLARPVDSAVPTLIVMGGNGAPTPPEVVRAHTRELTNASIVVDPVQAHNVIGSACLLELRNAWLNDPEPVRQPPGCLDRRLEW